jgi:ADP-ribosylglycohydrolase
MSALSPAASRGAAAILGAVVADAASLGTHWIYARAEVEKAIPGGLGAGGEFVPPVPSYHKLRKAGQGTMYGEGLLAYARTVAAAGGAFDEAAFLQQWKASFGLCGSFSGYADHTTRTTMFKMMQLAADNEAATMPPKGAPEQLRGPLYFGVKTAASGALEGTALRARAAAVAAELGAPEQAEWASGAAAAWERMLRGSVASDDVESNTFGKLVPAAVAAAGAPDFAERVARAVSVTQSHADVLGYCVPLARAVEAAVLGVAATPRAAVEAALPHFSAERAARVRDALALADAGEDTWAAVAKFGASCSVANTVPLTAFILARYGADGFAPAVRFNMVGDSAARACVVGAVLGALGGAGAPPEDWIARLDAPLREEAGALARAVAGTVTN